MNKGDLPMEIENILSQLKGISNTGMSKVASAEKPAQKKEAEAQKELLSSLSSALNKTGSEKKASESSSAPAELMKLATDMAGAEQEALVKQAHMYGAAVADGFVSRLGQYQAASTKVAAVKTAEDKVPTKEEWNKFAEENPELIKQAMALGYHDAQEQIAQMQQPTDQLQKLASTPEGREKLAAFKQGYEETVKEAVKLAEDCSVRGYQDTIKVLQAL
jgi:hypothetical protein